MAWVAWTSKSVTRKSPARPEKDKRAGHFSSSVRPPLHDCAVSSATRRPRRIGLHTRGGPVDKRSPASSQHWHRARMQTIPWPFLATEALGAHLLTFRELRRFHAAVYPGVWAPRGVEISAADRARAAWLWSARRGVVAGLSASAVLGARWIDADTSAELVYNNRRPPPRITVHADKLLPGEFSSDRPSRDDAGTHGVRPWSATRLHVSGPAHRRAHERHRRQGG